MILRLHGKKYKNSKLNTKWVFPWVYFYYPMIKAPVFPNNKHHLTPNTLKHVCLKVPSCGVKTLLEDRGRFIINHSGEHGEIMGTIFKTENNWQGVAYFMVQIVLKNGKFYILQ